MTVLAVIIFVLAAGDAVVATLALTGKLPGNNILGIRSQATRKNERYWTIAHKVAAPLWLASAAALAVAGVIALRVSDWMWIFFAVALLLAVVFLGVGASMGARTVALIDEQESEDEGCASGSCGCGDGGCGSDAGQEAGAADSPAVDRDALKRALGENSAEN